MKVVIRLTCCGLLLGASHAAQAQAQAQTQTDQNPISVESNSAQQSAPAQGLSDIVVTARKRSESVQNVPISMTALSSQDLRDRNVTTVSDISHFTPNLTFDVGARVAGASSASSITIRGIGQTDYTSAADPGVGLYVDGVYFSRTMGSVMDLLDVDHIEVLRGPQGTLFGKNTIGGAINIVSRIPKGDFAGTVEVKTGSFNRIDVHAGIEAPITDKLFVKLDFASRNRDGYGESRSADQKFGDANSRSGRIVLHAVPSDKVDLVLSADYTRERNGNQFQKLLALNPAVFNNPNNNGFLFNKYVASATPFGPLDSRYVSSPQSGYFNYATAPGYSNLESGGVGLTAVFNITDEVNLTSITAYRAQNSSSFTDLDASPLDFQNLALAAKQHQVSEELRLAGSSFGNRLKWMVGYYYYNERIHDYLGNRIYPGLYQALINAGFAANPAVDLQIDQFANLHNVNNAFFGQATLNITDKLSLTGGARYNIEDKDVDDISTRRIVSNVYLLPPGTTAHRSWNSFTPKASLEYKATRDVLLYASYAKGFKSGGYNLRVTNPTSFQSYNPEKVTTYETGFKSEWFGHRLRVNGAAYYSDYRDLQILFTVPPGAYTCPTTTSGLCSVVANAAKARIAGGELEVTVRPFAGFDLFGGLGYTDVKFTSIDPLLLASGIVKPTTKLPKTPEFSANVGGQYRFRLGSIGDLTLHGDYAYVSKEFQDITNSPIDAQKGFGLLNGRVAFDTADNKWELAVAVTNITDKTYITSGASAYNSLGYAAAGIGRPREWSLSGRVKF